mmetsp:Transcript_31132/g.46350  ORF Transcript_31132/g.46350 Transcript_31132/m.46350 type:complete len:143 (-) Transcript_31132:152-580(-)
MRMAMRKEKAEAKGNGLQTARAETQGRCQRPLAPGGEMGGTPLHPDAESGAKVGERRRGAPPAAAAAARKKAKLTLAARVVAEVKVEATAASRVGADGGEGRVGTSAGGSAATARTVAGAAVASAELQPAKTPRQVVGHKLN